MPIFDDFTEEEMKLQNGELIVLLEHAYQLPRVVLEIPAPEQEYILARARARLQQNISMASTGAHVLPDAPLNALTSTAASQGIGDFDYSLLPLTMQARPRRRSRLLLLVNLAAAVLVVALLAGTFAMFLLHSSPQSHTGGLSQSTQSPLPTQNLSCPIDIDAGMHYICLHGFNQTLNLTKDAGHNYRVTLTQSYADTNRVVIGYRVEQQVHGKYISVANVNILPLTVISHGVSLAFLGSTGQATGAARAAFYAVPMQLLYSLNTPRALDLQVKVSRLTVASSSPNAATLPANLTFNFAVPIHYGGRSVAITQTVTANGASLTLVSVGITFSETIFEVAYNPGTTKVLPGTIKLTSGQKQYSNNGGLISLAPAGPASLLASLNLSSGSDTGLLLNYPLNKLSGPVTLTVNGKAGNGVPTQPWVFTFTLPSPPPGA